MQYITLVILPTGRDGGLSDWNVVTPCSTTCGNGTQIRERTCTNPAPSGYGKNCTELGPTTEIVSCSSTPCKGKNDCLVNCNWSLFCEIHKHSLLLPCILDLSLSLKRYALSSYLYTFKKEIVLIVDGVFSNWSSYGSCSKTCGGGTQTRQRQCNNPTPANGGRNCDGAFNESRSCNNELCPGEK